MVTKLLYNLDLPCELFFFTVQPDVIVVSSEHESETEAEGYVVDLSRKKRRRMSDDYAVGEEPKKITVNIMQQRGGD